MIGIRTQEMPFEAVGDIMSHTSVVWYDGEETDIELDGVCALDIRQFKSIEDAIRASKMSYVGKYTAIIESDYWEYGQDPDEIILRDPVVKEILWTGTFVWGKDGLEEKREEG